MGELTKNWCVVRQPDGGPLIVEGKDLSEEDAHKLYEKRDAEIGDHKQTIWHQQGLPAKYIYNPVPFPEN